MSKLLIILSFLAISPNYLVDCETEPCRLLADKIRSIDEMEAEISDLRLKLEREKISKRRVKEELEYERNNSNAMDEELVEIIIKGLQDLEF